LVLTASGTFTTRIVADNNSVETKIKVATIMVRIVKEKIKEMQKRERGDK